MFGIRRSEIAASTFCRFNSSKPSTPSLASSTVTPSASNCARSFNDLVAGIFQHVESELQIPRIVIDYQNVFLWHRHERLDSYCKRRSVYGKNIASTRLC